MRERAAVRARWPVGNVGTRLTADGGQDLVEERWRPALARRTPHRRLLLDFAVAAQDREAGLATGGVGRVFRATTNVEKGTTSAGSTLVVSMNGRQ